VNEVPDHWPKNVRWYTPQEVDAARMERYLRDCRQRSFEKKKTKKPFLQVIK